VRAELEIANWKLKSDRLAQILNLKSPISNLQFSMER